MEKITRSAGETIELGRKFARGIKSGTVLGLVGGLGAGKTQFVKGIAQGLGIKENITSPTFVVMKKYKVKKSKSRKLKVDNLIHIDCYRLGSGEELNNLGLGEYIKQGNNVIVIEWADRVRDILPQNTVWVKIRVKGEKERSMVIIN